MLLSSLKSFVSWLQGQWTDTEIIWKGQSKEPSGTAWLLVYLLRDSTGVSHSDNRTSEALFNFTIFNTDLSNLYTLNNLTEKLSNIIEKKRISFDSGSLEFREFDSSFLEEKNSEQIKLQKEIEYVSIMVSARFFCVKK